MGTLIRTLADFNQKFEGFDDPNGTDVKDEKGFTRVLAGPDDLYKDLASGRFSTKRLQIGHHKFEPGLDHGLHHHETWEQFYFIIAGNARIRVGDEEEIVGPGGMAYMPAGVQHAFEPADGPLELLVIGAILDE
jgi:mannose-6-phosphate isomerase-like protein (cupin superfamily)